MAQEENEEIQAQASDAEIKTSKKLERKNTLTLSYLDSLDNYLILIRSLSSTLRQGWLELASARYSMGGSRVNSGLLNLKPHSAATKVELHHDIGGSKQFSLCEWASSDDNESSSGKENSDEDEKLNEKLCSRNSVNQESTLESTRSESKASLNKTENPPYKYPAKVLSVFGTLVSPKLRDSQLSFETALKTIVDIANARSSILEAHDALLKDMKNTEE